METDKYFYFNFKLLQLEKPFIHLFTIKHKTELLHYTTYNTIVYLLIYSLQTYDNIIMLYKS